MKIGEQISANVFNQTGKNKLSVKTGFGDVFKWIKIEMVQLKLYWLQTLVQFRFTFRYGSMTRFLWQKSLSHDYYSWIYHYYKLTEWSMPIFEMQSPTGFFLTSQRNEQTFPAIIVLRIVTWILLKHSLSSLEPVPSSYFFRLLTGA